MACELESGAEDGPFGSRSGFSVADEADQLGILENRNVELDGFFGIVIEPQKRRDFLDGWHAIVFLYLKWAPSCLVRSMIVLLGFIIAGMLVVGVVAAFLLYVSVLSILTAVAIITGLVGTLVFGYWAGCRGRELTRSVAGPALNSGAVRTSPIRI